MDKSNLVASSPTSKWLCEDHCEAIVGYFKKDFEVLTIPNLFGEKCSVFGCNWEAKYCVAETGIIDKYVQVVQADNN